MSADILETFSFKMNVINSFLHAALKHTVSGSRGELGQTPGHPGSFGHVCAL